MPLFFGPGGHRLFDPLQAYPRTISISIKHCLMDNYRSSLPVETELIEDDRSSSCCCCCCCCRSTCSSSKRRKIFFINREAEGGVRAAEEEGLREGEGWGGGGGGRGGEGAGGGGWGRSSYLPSPVHWEAAEPPSRPNRSPPETSCCFEPQTNQLAYPSADWWLEIELLRGNSWEENNHRITSFSSQTISIITIVVVIITSTTTAGAATATILLVKYNNNNNDNDNDDDDGNDNDNDNNY